MSKKLVMFFIVGVVLNISTLSAFSGTWNKGGNDWNGFIAIDSRNNTGTHSFTFSIPGSSEKATLTDGGYYKNSENYTYAQGSFTGKVSTTSSNHSPSLVD